MPTRQPYHPFAGDDDGGDVWDLPLPPYQPFPGDNDGDDVWDHWDLPMPPAPPRPPPPPPRPMRPDMSPPPPPEPVMGATTTPAPQEFMDEADDEEFNRLLYNLAEAAESTQVTNGTTIIATAEQAAAHASNIQHTHAANYAINPDAAGLTHNFEVVAPGAAVPFRAVAADEQAPTSDTVQTSSDIIINSRRHFQEQVMYTFTAKINSMQLLQDNLTEMMVNGRETMSQNDLRTRVTNAFVNAYMRERPLTASSNIVIAGDVHYSVNRLSSGGGPETRAPAEPSGRVQQTVRGGDFDAVRQAVTSHVSGMLDTTMLSMSSSDVELEQVVINISMDGVRTGAGVPQDLADRRAFYETFKICFGAMDVPANPDTGGKEMRLGQDMFCPVNSGADCFYHCLYYHMARNGVRRAFKNAHVDAMHLLSGQPVRTATKDFLNASARVNQNLSRHMVTSHMLRLCDQQLPDAFAENTRGVCIEDVFEMSILALSPIITFDLNRDMRLLPEFSVLHHELLRVLRHTPTDASIQERFDWFMTNCRGEDGLPKFSDAPHVPAGRLCMTQRIARDSPSRATLGAKRFLDIPGVTLERIRLFGEQSPQHQSQFLAEKDRAVWLGFNSRFSHFIDFAKSTRVKVWVQNVSSSYNGLGKMSMSSRTSWICVICGLVMETARSKHKCMSRRCATCRQHFGSLDAYLSHDERRRNEYADGRVRECSVCRKRISNSCFDKHHDECYQRSLRQTTDEHRASGEHVVRCNFCHSMVTCSGDFTMDTHYHTDCQGRQRKAKRCSKCHVAHPKQQPCRISRISKTTQLEWENTDVYVWDIESCTKSVDGSTVHVPNYIHVRLLPRPDVTWESDPGDHRKRGAKPTINLTQEGCDASTTLTERERKTQEECERKALLHFKQDENEWEFDDLTYFLEWVHKLARRSVFIAHNSKGYDAFLLKTAAIRSGLYPAYEHGSGQKLDGLGFKVTAEDENSGQVRTITVSFIDSMNWFPGPLSKLPVTLQCINRDVSKDVFPHSFHTSEHQHYVGTLPAREHWGDISDGDWQALCSRFFTDSAHMFAWQQVLWERGEQQEHMSYEEQTQLAREVNFDKQPFDLREYMKYYCKEDTRVLGLCMAVWRYISLRSFSVCPLIKSTTAASYAMHVYRSCFCKPEGIPTLTRFHEELARQAYAGGRTEKLTPFMCVREDGLDDIIGDLLSDDERQKHLDACRSRYGNRPRLSYIDVTSLYPTVMFFDRLPCDPPQTYVSQLFLGTLLPHERRQYVAHKAKLLDELPDGWENQEGIVMVDVRTKPASELPDDWVPLVGTKSTTTNAHNDKDRKFVFGCIEHAKTMTLTMFDFRLLRDDPNYFMDTIYRVDLMGSGSKDMFKEYIRFLYKMKEEASEPPANREEAEALADRVRRELDVELSVDKLMESENSGLRGLAKLLLNSLFGKFGQRTLTKTEWMSLSEYVDFLKTKVVRHPYRYRLANRRIYGDPEHSNGDFNARVRVRYLDIEDDSTRLRTNVAIAAYITAIARNRLVQMMRALQQLGCALAYCDTDSLVFMDPNGRTFEQLNSALQTIGSRCEIGSMLGQWKPEYEEGKHELLECAQIAAKTYSHKVLCVNGCWDKKKNKPKHQAGELFYTVKCKGMPVKRKSGRTTDVQIPGINQTYFLKDEKDWHWAYKQMVFGQAQQVQIRQINAANFVRRHGDMYMERQAKSFTRTGKDKRVMHPDGPLLPMMPLTVQHAGVDDETHPSKKAKTFYEERRSTAPMDVGRVIDEIAPTDESLQALFTSETGDDTLAHILEQVNEASLMQHAELPSPPPWEQPEGEDGEEEEEEEEGEEGQPAYAYTHAPAL
ncbi:hypothetical protein PTSG_03892 [Salpingoeca rosetta]|uniref:Sox C-terminal domain-containing protein n=1 Tax=Salpingoeca rosetta (strain ATCC 50818 / BSB-021) TaxID=946362 RepID=F2U5P6_SALR5|nr:uncharacterized protein PTSG_03892 [Salpingoeca rosetta]EGD83262.1 hypothetical protein PTSG_03892 [Salpingoeca rosetta]|eukprot:XP_004995626.1 hypothetical protein PTSG_03892 [Salpingoeca rosetta]